jgi:hypothetical protein
MKTQQEIEVLLEAYECELGSLQDWCKKAEKNYRNDKEMWGNQADDGEWRHANDEYSKVNEKVRLLKWILNKTETV